MTQIGRDLSIPSSRHTNLQLIVVSLYACNIQYYGHSALLTGNPEIILSLHRCAQLNCKKESGWKFIWNWNYWHKHVSNHVLKYVGINYIAIWLLMLFCCWYFSIMIYFVLCDEKVGAAACTAKLKRFCSSLSIVMWTKLPLYLAS